MSAGTSSSTSESGEHVPNVLLIVDRVPSRDNGYGLRISNVIAGLASRGRLHVLYLDVSGTAGGLPASSAYSSEVIVARRPRGIMRLRFMFRRVPTDVHYSNPRSLRRSIHAAVAGVQWDLVWCGRARTHVLAKDSIEAPCIVDLDDLNDQLLLSEIRDRSARHGRASTALRNVFDWIDAVRWSRLQRRIADEVNRVVVCSESDRDILAVANAVVIQNGYPDPVEAAVPGSGAQPAIATSAPSRPAPAHQARPGRSIIFVGPMTYEPNLLAVTWFVDDVLPLVQLRHPDAMLTVVGHERPWRRDRQDVHGVEFVGHVPDVAPYYELAEVAVVPLHSGGGTPLKVIEALARSVPLVSTTFGAAGYDLVDGREALIADEPDAFAGAVCALLDSHSARHRLATAGRARFENGLSAEASHLAIGDLAVSTIRGHLADEALEAH